MILPQILFFIKRNRKETMSSEHILIIRLSAIGDVAMTVPVVYSLARNYPSLRISVLSRPYARPFFSGIGDNVEFIGVDLKKEYAGIKGLNKLYNLLKSKNFTVVADMHNILRTKYLRMRFRLSGKKVAAIDKHRKGKRLLTRKNNKVMEQQPSSFDNYKEVLTKLGYTFDVEFNSIFEGKKINFNSIYENFGEKKSKWIGIAPFANHQGKIYPIERMKKVISILSERMPDVRVFLFGGGKSEMDVFNQWQNEFPCVTNASAVLGGIENELLLMNKLDLMLSMDSANSHIASLVGTKVISIWGATHPYAGFKSWNMKDENIIQNTLSCRPCSVYGNKKCIRGDYECLNIDENKIVDKIIESMN